MQWELNPQDRENPKAAIGAGPRLHNSTPSSHSLSLPSPPPSSLLSFCPSFLFLMLSYIPNPQKCHASCFMNYAFLTLIVATRLRTEPSVASRIAFVSG